MSAGHEGGHEKSTVWEYAKKGFGAILGITTATAAIRATIGTLLGWPLC